MDLSLINPATADLLSRITGRKLGTEDITPLTLFIAALMTVLLGVILADTQVHVGEEVRLQRMMDHFASIDDTLYQLMQVMIGGIDWHHVYLNPEYWLILTHPLSAAERLLLIGLGHQMSIADHKMDVREKKYLQTLAEQIAVKPKHFKLIQAGLSGEGKGRAKELKIWQEVQELMEPNQFKDLSPTLVSMAEALLTDLSAS